MRKKNRLTNEANTKIHVTDSYALVQMDKKSAPKISSKQ